jgi:hypothetical protein
MDLLPDTSLRDIAGLAALASDRPCRSLPLATQLALCQELPIVEASVAREGGT